MALLTAPLSDFEIPNPWAQQVQSKIDAILEAERTRLAFAQIFDGIQTQGAAAEMGDVESSMDLPLPQDVTKDAREHAKFWLAAKEIRNVLVNTLVAMEALRIVRSNFLLDVDKIRALVLGFIKPVVRSCLREYASSLVATGRTIPITSFQQQCRDKRSDIDAIEDWGEEYIFGGLLVHQEDGYKVGILWWCRL